MKSLWLATLEGPTLSQNEWLQISDYRNSKISDPVFIETAINDKIVQGWSSG